jgi:sporulation protein YlmC with PRC-barrel domain
MPVRPLSELTDWELVDASQDLRGKHIIDDSGHDQGEVADLLVDTESKRVASVRTHNGRIIPIKPLQARRSEVVLHDGPGAGLDGFGPVALAKRPPHTKELRPLRTGSQLRQASVEAEDGEIGSLHDIYFDDQTWAIRYLVIDTAKWLFGRKVLISPEAMAPSDGEATRIRLNLTREQIKNSPPRDSDPPVSKQYQDVLQSYYGWGAAATPPSAVVGAPIVIGSSYGLGVPPVPMVEHPHTSEHDYDEHLRSMKEVIGYQVQSGDEDVGEVSDFAFDAATPHIHSLLARPRRGDSRQTFLVPVRQVARIDWTSATVEISDRKQAAGGHPDWEPDDAA